MLAWFMPNGATDGRLRRERAVATGAKSLAAIERVGQSQKST